MGTLDDLVAVFADLVEMQMPAAKDLPVGVDSASWIKSQGVVHGQIDANGSLIGFKPDGMPGVLSLAKLLRSANPAYARGTRLRSFLDRVIVEIVKLKRSKAGGAVQQRDLDALESAIGIWFAAVAVPRQHLIPCSILLDPALTFSIGPVQFIHVTNFSTAQFGGVPATDQINFGYLGKFMQERAATWIAVVPVNGCDEKRSAELANLATDVALAAVQLVIPPEYAALAARITGRTRPPYSVQVAVVNQMPSPTITNSEPGKGMDGDSFSKLLKDASATIHSAGLRVENFLTGLGQLPKLDRAWCDAAFWFHEALAEPLDTIAIAKLETSIENLFGAGNLTESTARLLQAIRGVFGLSKSDLIALGSTVTVGKFAASIARARSQILHGTWSTLGDEELPLTQGEVARLAHVMLVSYTLYLDEYAQTTAPEDKAKPFIDWMETQAPVKLPTAAAASPVQPSPPPGS